MVAQSQCLPVSPQSQRVPVLVQLQPCLGAEFDAWFLSSRAAGRTQDVEDGEFTTDATYVVAPTALEAVRVCLGP